MKLRDWSIGKRLALGFCILLAGLIINTGVGMYRLQGVADATRAMMDAPLAKERLISEWYRIVFAGIRRTTVMARSSDTTLAAQFADEIAASTARAQELIKKIDALSTDEDRKMMEELITYRKAFVAGRDAINKAKSAGEMAEADRILTQQYQPAAKGYEAMLQKMLDHQKAEIDRTAHEIDAIAAQSRNLQLLLAALTVAFSIGFAWWLTSGITGPISEAVRVARRVADGDLTGDAAKGEAAYARDETGQLLLALEQMHAGLVRIVAQVRTGTECITAASTQIASGNLNLSSRTEQQASSLEETASSMEQLTSTVRQNADNAREANTMAGAASTVARKGGGAVSDVVGTMHSIEESSRRIVDIIAVIDGIAFQTNILALNAAVEAARAGEQGRGFAVVASEVRNLAQRSAAAARDIKTLISDSVSKVNEGARHVEQAGATMDEVVAAIERVTAIMGDITSASQEQSDGIDQINLAITAMDNATQQNAALVEEAAAAAQAMREQADRLADAVAVFKLDGHAAAMQQPAPPRQGPVPRPAAAPAVPYEQGASLVARAGGKRAEPAAAARGPSSSDGGWEEF
ncbi:methyl-accepting chemotaxis protein [Pseudoduganella ginsengisoli]|uniref:HAMP domain-containing protein n=1 Tax=Pseudoduganella ginsengisoli TaxID=1462440 RepID=A0A6L6Q372_9BURK|nr:methyl-accepting chemotaxis protein [Pseudoduganella ginsengisoli]MTW04055.1 HAMP domain-containing protein [Pseudoduganella ginsengisoli]